LILKIEEFILLHHRLPDNLAEINLTETESDKAFYKKTDNGCYIVWYGLAVGQSMIYSSETKKWNMSD